MTDRQTIWIIVPVYNNEKKIAKCIRSIEHQTFTNWKLILVDDGSKDFSGKICDDYAQMDERILVIHTVNMGSSKARINGIKDLDDESYCMFCDSDDTLPKNALELLYRAISDTDMSCGNIQKVCKFFRLPEKKEGVFHFPGKYKRNRILSELYVSCFGVFHFPINLCGKLFRTKKLKKVMLNLREYPRYFADDLNVMIHLLPELDSVSIIDDVVYYYRIGGGTSKFMPTFWQDNLLMYEIKKQLVDKCISKIDIRRLIDIELKNIAVSYLIMCEKSSNYPHGTLMDEVRYICNSKEMKTIVGALEHDMSGVEGINDALKNRDMKQISKIIRKEVNRTKVKDILKSFILS